MKNRIIAVIFAAAALAVPMLAQTDYALLQSVSALAQIAQLPKPSPIEKELAARASHVDEITLDKKMLSFATQFMNSKQSNNPQDEEATRKLMESLDGMYVRNYEFDKEGQFTAAQIEQLRAYYESSEWSPMVRNRDRKSGESSDVMLKLVNGESRGMFILDVAPREVSIILILGPVQMQDLQKVMRIAGRGSQTGEVGTAKGPQAVKEKKEGPQPQNIQESMTVLHATTQLVLVDVHVSGPHGAPVQGLSKSDFEVKENGVRQELKSFEEHSPKIDQSELPALDSQLPAHTFVNLEPAARKGPPVVIVFDQLNTSLDAQMYAYGQILKYLESKDAGTEVALFSIGDRLIMLQGFTTDSQRLIAAMKSHDAKPKLTIWGGNSFLWHQPSAYAKEGKADQTIRGGNPFLWHQPSAYALEDKANQTIWGGNSFLSRDTEAYAREFWVSESTLDDLAELGQFLAAVPGRKNLLWFSSSFSALPLLSEDRVRYDDIAEQLRKVSAELAVSQTAVYPIDARGLSTSGSQWMNATQDTMLDIAEATGGKAFMNNNGLAHAASKAVEEGSYYYTLSYSPTNAKFDERLRRIKVRLKKQDSGQTYHLSYRTAYFAEDPAVVAPVSAKRNALAAALVDGTPNMQSILFKVQVDPEGPAKPAPQVSPQADAQAPKVKGKDHSAGESVTEKVQTYALRFDILANHLKFTKAEDGRTHSVLDIVVAAYAADGRKLGGTRQHLEAAMSRKELDQSNEKGFYYPMSVDLPVDAARMRVVIRDPATGRVGSLEIALPL